MVQTKSPFVQNDVVVKNFTLGPNDSAPKSRINGDGQADTDNEGDEAVSDCWQKWNAADCQVHQQEDAKKEGKLTTED